MLIEKFIAGFGIASVSLLLWKAGNVQLLHFIAVCSRYAHAADYFAAWGN